MRVGCCRGGGLGLIRRQLSPLQPLGSAGAEGGPWRPGHFSTQRSIRQLEDLVQVSMVSSGLPCSNVLLRTNGATPLFSRRPGRARRRARSIPFNRAGGFNTGLQYAGQVFSQLSTGTRVPCKPLGGRRACGEALQQPRGVEGPDSEDLLRDGLRLSSCRRGEVRAKRQRVEAAREQVRDLLRGVVDVGWVWDSPISS